VEGWIESAVIAVVISSLVTVAGWYATHRSERVLEAARRRERVQDIQTALLADIRSTTNRFQVADPDQHLERVVALFRSASPDGSYTPFVPREPGSLLWSSIAAEVHILPTDVIEPVVLFFSQLETIRFFVDDLRSERYAELEQARKIAMFEDYVKMSKYLVHLGREADTALSRSLGVTPVSSSGGVRSSPSAASGREAAAEGVAGRSA